MEPIRIFSIRKNTVIPIAVSLACFIAGFFIYQSAEPVKYNRHLPFFIETAGILAMLCSFLGILGSLLIMIRQQTMLIIDSTGIIIGGKKEDKILWQHIVAFSELSIGDQKFINVNINNSQQMLVNEPNKIKRKLLENNLQNYGTPINISAELMDINYDALLLLLNAKLSNYKSVT